MKDTHAEIERKFLVRSFPTDVTVPDKALWRKTAFLVSSTPTHTKRVRAELMWPHFLPASEPCLSLDPPREGPGWQAFYDEKTRDTQGNWQSQRESTRPIDIKTAWTIFDNKIDSWVTKVRYRINIPYGDAALELDIFTKPVLRGLVIAEVELLSLNERVQLPEGFDVAEVTEDARFQNVRLARITSPEELGRLVDAYRNTA